MYINRKNIHLIQWSILCFILTFSCKNSIDEQSLVSNFITDNSTFDQDKLALDSIAQLIQTTSQNCCCTDSQKWLIAPMGSKPCGGPTQYIAYSADIDTLAFRQLVVHFGENQKLFNEKWGIMSDCAVPQQPKGVECKKGVPTFTYY